jgi:DNA-binding GntR family transcriptional regulator
LENNKNKNRAAHVKKSVGLVDPKSSTSMKRSSELMATNSSRQQSHTTKKFPTAQRSTLREIVYSELYIRVINGTLRRGTRLNESKIAQQMGISRGPVREAIRQLEQDGLLVSSPGKGTFVVGLSLDDLKDCYILRIALESLAVRLLMEKINVDEINELDQYIQQMKQSKPTDKKMPLLTGKFHAKICELTGNKALLRAYQTMSDQMKALSLPVLSHIYKDSDEFARRHQQILEAIRSRKIQHAQKVIEDHISEAGQKVVNFLAAGDKADLKTSNEDIR